ncbi:MAG: hypothetical protein ABH826_01050 [Patescibacteria group bacterium]|nr:hypothetical protein [Patescibacteria group bacterium]
MEGQGISRIEILIVGLVIGLLGLAAVLAIMNARAQARDAVRLSDVRQVQAGLEMYFNDSSEYPKWSTSFAIGEASTACLSDSGFSASCNQSTDTVYLDLVPAPPRTGLDGMVECSGIKDSYCYFSSGQSYLISFELEKNNSLLGLGKGANCATERGFQLGACPIPAQ